MPFGHILQICKLFYSSACRMRLATELELLPSSKLISILGLILSMQNPTYLFITYPIFAYEDLYQICQGSGIFFGIHSWWGWSGKSTLFVICNFCKDKRIFFCFYQFSLINVGKLCAFLSVVVVSEGFKYWLR